LYSWSAPHEFLPGRWYIDHGIDTAIFCIMTEVTPMSGAFSVTQAMNLAMGGMGPTCSPCWDDVKINLAVHKLITPFSHYADANFAGKNVTISPSNGTALHSTLPFETPSGPYMLICVLFLTLCCHAELTLAPGREKKSSCEAQFCRHYSGSHSQTSGQLVGASHEALSRLYNKPLYAIFGAPPPCGTYLFQFT
jgi:hypothetical protein